MILGPDGKPVSVEPAGDVGPDPHELRLTMGTPEGRALIEARKAEMDAGYQLIEDALAKAMFADMEPGPRPPLTRQQRVRIAWARIRGAFARKLVAVANWISPGIATEDCDC